MSGENSANLSACLHSSLTLPEDGLGRGMREGSEGVTSPKFTQ